MEVFSCTIYQVIASFDYSGNILKCCIGFGGGGGERGIELGMDGVKDVE